MQSNTSQLVWRGYEKITSEYTEINDGFIIPSKFFYMLAKDFLVIDIKYISYLQVTNPYNITYSAIFVAKWRENTPIHIKNAPT